MIMHFLKRALKEKFRIVSWYLVSGIAFCELGVSFNIRSADITPPELSVHSVLNKSQLHNTQSALELAATLWKEYQSKKENLSTTTAGALLDEAHAVIDQTFFAPHFLKIKKITYGYGNQIPRLKDPILNDTGNLLAGRSCDTHNIVVINRDIGIAEKISDLECSHVDFGTAGNIIFSATNRRIGIVAADNLHGVCKMDCITPFFSEIISALSAHKKNDFIAVARILHRKNDNQCLP